MSDPNVKRCNDYAAVGIETGYSTQRGWYVDREGRCLGEWTTPDEAAMFAEELYERLRRVTDQQGEAQCQKP